jgi:hypothetical protein
MKIANLVLVFKHFIEQYYLKMPFILRGPLFSLSKHFSK